MTQKERDQQEKIKQLETLVEDLKIQNEELAKKYSEITVFARNKANEIESICKKTLKQKNITLLQIGATLQMIKLSASQIDNSLYTAQVKNRNSI